MKSFKGTAAMLTLVVGMAACVDTAEQAEDTLNDTASDMQTQQPAVSDAEIAHITKTANDADIENGRLAQERGRSADVKSFGALMVSDHTALNEQAGQLAQAAGLTPADNATSQQLATQHQAVKQRLEQLQGAAFDTAYIANEVNFHQTVLDALDQTLIPNAQNPDLRNLLNTARTQIEAHLNRARDIQGKLGNSN